MKIADSPGPLGHPRKIVPYLERYMANFYRPDFYEPEDNTPVLVVLDKDAPCGFMPVCPLHIGRFDKVKGFCLSGRWFTRFDITSWSYPPYLVYVGKFEWAGINGDGWVEDEDGQFIYDITK